MFNEIQSFKKWWQLLIFAIPHGIFLFGLYQQVILNKPFGDNPMPNVGLFIAEGVMIVLSYFFLLLRLETSINEEGIMVRFYPIQRKFRQYKWERIEEAYVREFSPILEYGGWGFRTSMKGNGKAWTASGNKGLQIITKDGSKFLVGTQMSEELDAVISRYMKKY